MAEVKTLEALKQAILLEKRGKTFYLKVAEQSEYVAVSKFFELMAEEEQDHIEILHKQFKSFKESGKFENIDLGKFDPSLNAEQVLSEEIKTKISGADFESAAIAAAISMEEKAIALYSERAENATDPEEKKVFEWLSNWEKTHLNYLFDIDKDLTERIWQANDFWPF
jgi:rubrerythrin